MAVRDVVQAAAGVGGGDNLYVEDVFSTYLYTGNGTSQTIENGIALGDSNYGPSVEFDGTNDYLSRSSDLTGNADSKTFTFSMWVYRPVDQTGYYYEARTTGGLYRFIVSINTAEKLRIIGKNSGGTNVFDFDTTTTVPFNTWTHVILSIDLANTSNRYVYINDTTASATYGTYTNDSIAFSGGTHSVGANGAGGSKVKGRLSSVFLDYTYRDLSVEANRRLFITADGQPATGQASLSPILYMPLDGSTATVGTNSGTGGDFTVNGSPTVLTQGGPYTEAGYGEGGMVWTKARSLAQAHLLFDTERGPLKYLTSQATQAESTYNNSLTAFNSNGFSVGSASDINVNGQTTASWTFRKAPKFFDVVTYTGNGTDDHAIPHNLGVTPGCIITKRTDSADDWTSFHRGLDATNPYQYWVELNTTSAKQFDSKGIWFKNPDDTNFYLSSYSNANASGGTYVAYVFAHDAGGFGDDGEQNVISCGSYTDVSNTGNPSQEINLGFEPQFLMIKTTSRTSAWYVFDNMRGMSTQLGKFLQANTSDPEYSASGDYTWYPTATGFHAPGFFGAGEEVIYIAIRRPMKTPEAGTEVFSVQTKGTLGAPAYNAGFPVDALFVRNNKNTTFNMQAWDRLRSTFSTTSTAAVEEAFNSGYLDYFDSNDGFDVAGGPDTNDIAWMFRRAPFFMDVVAYTGTGSGYPRTKHNLGVTPELVIFKNRNSTGDWWTWTSYYDDQGSYALALNKEANSGGGLWGSVLFNSTDLGQTGALNTASNNYIAYLFATLAGVSKVGGYTGNGTNQTIDCGFSAGARFVLIKRTGQSVDGDWNVFDTTRGIVAGNDPRLELNTTNAEDTGNDGVDPSSSGFIVNYVANDRDDVNISGATYIFLAIA